MSIRISALICLAAAIPALLAQTISGDLVVSVADPSNLAVSGGTLELIHRDTNIRQQAKTDEQGLYLFSQLKPGQSDHAFECAGCVRAAAHRNPR